MELLSKNVNENFHKSMEATKRFLSMQWPILLTGFIFSITRIRFLTYPLGLLHRHVIEEGYRSYEVIDTGARFGFSITMEQPFYVLLLQIGYIILGKSPTALIFWGRTLNFIFSALTLILIYKISEMTFGDVTAKFAAFLYSVCPYGIFLDLGIQRESLMWLFGLCSLYFLLKYIKTSDDNYVFISLALSLLALMTKSTGIYFLFTNITCLTLFYSGSPKGIRITFRRRFVMFCFVSFGILLVLFLFAWSSIDGSLLNPFTHSIVFEPEALISTEFWGNIIVFAMLYIPITTVLLGVTGLFQSVLSQKKEEMIIVIWIFFSGIELVFFGNGAIINEYFILYLLHPLVILAGNTIFHIYQSSLKQVINNGHSYSRYINPFLILLLFISIGLIPLFDYTGEEKVVRENEPLYREIRSIGLFLKYYDVQGEDILIIYLQENHSTWRSQLSLIRTYIAKPKIREHFALNISAVVDLGNYKAIIGWSDDLNQSRNTLLLYFGSYRIYPQNISFQETYILSSIELWFNPY